MRTRTLSGWLSALALLASGTLAGAQQPESKPADYQPRTLSPAPEMQVVSPTAQGVSVTQSGRGKLLVVLDTWDFGYVPQDAHVSHRYLVQNVGDDTLFIEEVKPTCGCTVTLLEKKELAPGEKVPVTITLGTAKFSGALTKKVHVISSDKEMPKYPLTFTAHVGPAPDLALSSGSTIDLGQVAKGVQRNVKVSLTNTGAAPVKVQIAEAPPYVTATLSGANLGAKSSIDVALATADPSAIGPLKGSLTIEMLGAQTSRVTIPITGVGVAN